MKIEQATPNTITELWSTIESKVQQAKALEDAAQALATAEHTRFDESVVIARVFLTVPFDALPASNKAFVQKLAESAGAASGLKGSTPVLSLVGTHGREADWKDRRKSKGHAGIPLISSAFVGAIPMISRLLRELGVPMEWVDSHDSEVIVKAVGREAGLFYVDNAAEATDHQGRKIIAAQDFVSAYNVRSVFGVGGAYADGRILVNVLFCRDGFDRSVAGRFLPLVEQFKGKTTSLVGGGKIFAAA